MTDLRQAAQQALEALETKGEHHPRVYAAITALRTALEQQAEPPSEWEVIKNILSEYGLDAIAFVANWKAAQRQWVGLTDEDLDYLCHLAYTGDEEFALAVQDKLKELNT